MASQKHACGHVRSGSRHASTASASVTGNEKASHALPLQPFHVPSDIDLTIRNLRFLDLDLYPDWPGLTRETFRDVSRDVKTKARTKVQTAEWILYKLFELYDAKETRAKLQQFFPALEPRQSIALRAALFQLLTSLRQHGALPRECTLRRSVLDECKGERFEELLFYFSSMVLRHVASKPKQDRNSPLTRIATMTTFNDEDEALLEPLALTFQNSLTASLDQRRKLRARLQGLQSTLTAQGEELDERNASDKATSGVLEKLLYESNTNTRALKRQLRDACEANLDWVNLAISGDNNTDRMPPFEAHFDQLWQNTILGSDDRFDQSLGHPETVLIDLDARVSAAKDRLENWRAFQSTLSMRNEELTISRSPLKTPRKSPSKGSPSKSPRKTTSVNAATPRSPSKGSVTPSFGQLRRHNQSVHASGHDDPMVEAYGPKATSKGLANIIENANPLPPSPQTSQLAESPLVRPLTSDQTSKRASSSVTNPLAFATNQQYPAGSSLQDDTTPQLDQTPLDQGGRQAVMSPRELRRTPMTFTISRPYMGTPTITKLKISEPLSAGDGTVHSVAGAEQNAIEVKTIQQETEAKLTESQPPVRKNAPDSLAERARQSMALVDTLHGQRSAFLASDNADTHNGDIPTESRLSRERRPLSHTLSSGSPLSTGMTDWIRDKDAMTLSERVQVSVGNRTTLGATDRLESINQPPVNRLKHANGRRASKAAANGHTGDTIADKSVEGLNELATAMGTVKIGADESNEHDTMIDMRPKTPIGELFKEGADYGSVFKSRSKMRRSPPPSVVSQMGASPWD